MRIIGGRLRGRLLQGPSQDGRGAIRPTSDRLRESLFNILVHAYENPMAAAHVIDLFAGTGALGLEALSRGARFALFVEQDFEARALIRANVEALGLGGETRLFRHDATKLNAAPAGEKFTLAFLDPPYGRGFIGPALSALDRGGWLSAGALCVIEERADITLELPPNFEMIDAREQSGSRMNFVRYGVESKI